MNPDDAREGRERDARRTTLPRWLVWGWGVIGVAWLLLAVLNHIDPGREGLPVVMSSIFGSAHLILFALAMWQRRR